MAANLERLAQEYKERGHPQMANYLNKGAELARQLGVPESFDVDEAAVLVEAKLTVSHSETPVEIKRFSEEQKEALKKQGFMIYGLTGQSLATLQEGGRRFLTKVSNPEDLSSMHSEVAINPSSLFLPESDSKSSSQQEEMIDRFSEELGKKVSGVKAIMGEVPDYAELAFLHLEATGKYLFGNYKYAITKTKTAGFLTGNVGNFKADGGLDVSWSSAGHDFVLAAPLVVPV